MLWIIPYHIIITYIHYHGNELPDTKKCHQIQTWPKKHFIFIQTRMTHQQNLGQFSTTAYLRYKTTVTNNFCNKIDYAHLLFVPISVSQELCTKTANITFAYATCETPSLFLIWFYLKLIYKVNYFCPHVSNQNGKRITNDKSLVTYMGFFKTYSVLISLWKAMLL